MDVHDEVLLEAIRQYSGSSFNTIYWVYVDKCKAKNVSPLSYLSARRRVKKLIDKGLVAGCGWNGKSLHKIYYRGW